MKFSILLILSVFVLSQCEIACQSAKDSTSSIDSVIKVLVNDSVDVRLEACLTCGYDWFLEPVDTLTVKLLNKSSRPKNPDPGIVGGNAIELWRFVALQPGSFLLVFHYKRPWEEEILKTERIRVIVTPSKQSRR